jgi:hypothetical protein
MDPAGPQELKADHLWVPDPSVQGLAGGLGDLEADRLARLALNHRGAFPYTTCGVDIPHPQGDKVTPAQLAFDCHVEEREIAGIACYLEPDPN